MDYTLRTDVWFSNEEVLAYNAEHGVELDPWDADSDNDGLTDGQEIHSVPVFEPLGLEQGDGEPDLFASTGAGVTEGLLTLDEAIPYEALDPANPDSSGNGWWDGWIGVHGAGYNSQNVILYMEHLWTGEPGLASH